MKDQIYNNSIKYKKGIKNYSLLINSTDNFEDCWFPFFKLFNMYWPNFNGSLYLNTELKSFDYPQLQLNVIQNNINDFVPKITWSECLIRALQSIDDEIVLYMQDDYFLKKHVKNDIVENYVDLMHRNMDIHCIHLTNQAVLAESSTSKYEGLRDVKLKQRYRISCQAALWRKSVLLLHLRKNENAWQFEEFGSRRSAILRHNFYVVNPELIKLDDSEIVPYIFTGIIQGKWNKKVVSLFESNGIKINYSKRGFYNYKSSKPFLIKAKYYYNRIPIILAHFFDSIMLKKINAI